MTSAPTKAQCKRCGEDYVRLSNAGKYCEPCKAIKVTGWSRSTYLKDHERNKARRRQWSRDNQAAQYGRQREWAGQNPARVLVNTARFRAKGLSVPFGLSPADIAIPEVCPYLGIPLVPGEGHTHAGSPTIDRIIPALGYVKGNVQVISHKANAMKQDASPEMLRAFALAVLKDPSVIYPEESEEDNEHSDEHSDEPPEGQC